MKVKGRTLDEIKIILLQLFVQYLNKQLTVDEFIKQAKSLDHMRKGHNLWFKFSKEDHTAITIDDMEKALRENAVSRGFGMQAAKLSKQEMTNKLKRAVKLNNFTVNYS